MRGNGDVGLDLVVGVDQPWHAAIVGDTVYVHGGIRPGYADGIHEEGFAPLKDLMANFVKAGGKIYVCSPCFKKRKLDETQLIDGATIVGGAKLVEFMGEACPSVSY